MKLRSVLVAFVLLVGSAAPALANGQPVAPGWKVYSYAPSGNALMSHQADASDDGLAAFTFLATPDIALLATERPEGPHASILGKTITASIRVDAAAGTSFTYYGQDTSWNPCGTPASVRFYFNTNGKFGFGTDNDWYSKYWWSNPTSVALANGTFTLTTTVDAALWSNWNGKTGNDPVVDDHFALAAANPDLIGFSFGGGCFFENGVGAAGGTATFTVLSFDIED